MYIIVNSIVDPTLFFFVGMAIVITHIFDSKFHLTNDYPSS